MGKSLRNIAVPQGIETSSFGAFLCPETAQVTV
jgi:hypothetical protein